MTELIERPGKELPKYWRDIAAALLEHGWSYRRRKKHPQLVSPEGVTCGLPTTVTEGHAGHRAAYLTNLKRAGAPIENGVVLPPEREKPRPVVPVFHAPDMETVSTAEWRATNYGADWWRARYQGVVPEQQPAKPRTAPTKPKAQVQAERVLEVLARYQPKPEPPVDVEDRRKSPKYTLAEVRAMLRRGYPAAQVCRITGWGGYWIADLVGPDGYYRQDAG